MSLRGVRIVVILLGAILAPLSASADPPAQVARVSFVAGPVSFRPASADEWAAATMNYPVTIGDHLWTDTAARTELELGASTVRLAPFTEFSVLNLDAGIAQFRITQGAISVRVRSLNQGDLVEIDTPEGAVSVLQPGLYRVDVNDAGDVTTVTVRHGDADVATNTSFPLHDNQSVVISNANPSLAPTAAIGMDDFDNWVLTRDRREQTAVQGASYVSPEIVGAADLGQYGTWRDAPGYGAMWMPGVSAGWVPYRYGHWTWVDPWGWTWIDDAPWGFAPFHYGRWVATPAGWGWIPGRIQARPVYAPALVAFVGGDGFRVAAVAGPPVAWFPLGAREVYTPTYRVSAVYVQTINNPHVIVADAAVGATSLQYVNRTVPGAVTAVPRDVFVRARPVAAAATVVPVESARAAVVVTTAVPPRPDHIVVAGAVHVAAPPPAVMARRVIVKQAPPAPAAAPSTTTVVTPATPVQVPRAGAAPAAVASPAAAPASPRPIQPEGARPAAAAPTPTTAAPVPQTVTPPPPPRPNAQANAQIAARHAQERAAIDARHAAERTQLQAQHQEAERQANAAQRQQLKVQHQAETKAMQERHQQERAALQQKQAAERKQ
jgi:hypothetical protein